MQLALMAVVGSREHASLVLMTFPFVVRNDGASEKDHPGWGACKSEKQELRTGPVALRQRLDRQYCAPIIRKSRGKMTAAVRACRRAGTRLQLLVFRSRPPRPGRLPWCLKGVADGASVLLVIACPSVTSAPFPLRRLVLRPLSVPNCYCGDYRSRSNKPQQRILKLI